MRSCGLRIYSFNYLFFVENYHRYWLPRLILFKEFNPRIEEVLCIWTNNYGDAKVKFPRRWKRALNCPNENCFHFLLCVFNLYGCWCLHCGYHHCSRLSVCVCLAIIERRQTGEKNTYCIALCCVTSFTLLYFIRLLLFYSHSRYYSWSRINTIIHFQSHSYKWSVHEFQKMKRVRKKRSTLSALIHTVNCIERMDTQIPDEFRSLISTSTALFAPHEKNGAR